MFKSIGVSRKTNAGQEFKINVTLVTSLFVEIVVLVFFFLFFFFSFDNTFLINLAANKLTFRVIPKGFIPFKSLLFNLNSLSYK